MSESDDVGEPGLLREGAAKRPPQERIRRSESAKSEELASGRIKFPAVAKKNRFPAITWDESPVRPAHDDTCGHHNRARREVVCFDEAVGDALENAELVVCPRADSW
jgi:hypothetical protein